MSRHMPSSVVGRLPSSSSVAAVGRRLSFDRLVFRCLSSSVVVRRRRRRASSTVVVRHPSLSLPASDFWVGFDFSCPESTRSDRRGRGPVKSTLAPKCDPYTLRMSKSQPSAPRFRQGGSFTNRCKIQVQKSHQVWKKRARRIGHSSNTLPPPSLSK